MIFIRNWIYKSLLYEANDSVIRESITYAIM